MTQTHCHQPHKQPGQALILTLVVITMLVLEVAVISLIAIRGFGEEGLLMSQNISTRRAAEIALNRLNTSLVSYLNTTGTPAGADTAYAQNVSPITSITLTLDNPDGGTSSTSITIDAWVKERKGNLYHLVGRARQGTTDILMHRWIPIQACPDGLQLIMSDRYITTPSREWYWNTQYPFVMTSSEDRVFFGENSSTGEFWTWDETDGLSTIVTGEYKPGYEAMAVASDGRVFFGEPNPVASGSFWTWKADTGLSTIVDGAQNGIYPAHVFVGTDGRVAFSEYNQSFTANRGKIWTWKNGVLSTIYTPSAGGWGVGVFGMGPDSRIYYTANPNGDSDTETYYWLDGTPPTTGLVLDISIELARVAPDGRIFMQRKGQSDPPALIYTWKPGLSSVSSSSPLYSWNYDTFQLGADSSNNFYITKSDNSSTNDACYVSNGTTSITIASGGGTNNLCYPLSGMTQVDSKIYLSGMVYEPGTGLTTKYLSSGNNNLDDMVVDSTGRVSGNASDAPGAFITWKDGTLSTIVSGVDTMGERSVAVNSDGRVFFGQNASSGTFWTWKEGVGLSTLATGTKIGYFSTATTSAGRVFFGETGSNARFWTWKERNCGAN